MKELSRSEYEQLQREVFRLARVVLEHAPKDIGFELVVTYSRDGYFAGMARAGNIDDADARPLLQEAADKARSV